MRGNILLTPMIWKGILPWGRISSWHQWLGAGVAISPGAYSSTDTNILRVYFPLAASFPLTPMILGAIPPWWPLSHWPRELRVYILAFPCFYCTSINFFLLLFWHRRFWKNLLGPGLTKDKNHQHYKSVWVHRLRGTAITHQCQHTAL